MRIYLDNNATTPLDPEVLDVIIAELAKGPHNPSSFHAYGQEGKKTLSEARASIAKRLGVKSSEIFFTSGGTEGLNLLIRGYGAKHIITTSIEHAAVYNTVQSLDTEITYLTVGTWGAPLIKTLEKALRPDTSLIVLSAANGETGVLLDIPAFAALAKKRNIPLILDGVTLLGKIPCAIPDGVAGMAFSAHKFHGPPGVGFIYLKSGEKLTPIITGGGQEKKLRSGTENLPAIVGMAKALEQVDPPPPVNPLRDLFEALLFKALPDLEINGTGPRLPSTSNLYFPGVEGESLLIALDMEQIACSHASACSAGALEPSRVLLNMGYTKERASSSLRFSFSHMNTQGEVEAAAATIIKLVSKLRTYTH